MNIELIITIVSLVSAGGFSISILIGKISKSIGEFEGIATAKFTELNKNMHDIAEALKQHNILYVDLRDEMLRGFHSHEIKIKGNTDDLAEIHKHGCDRRCTECRCSEQTRG